MPTLLLAGAEDAVASPAMMQRLASKIGHATTAVIHSAGHLANLEQADVFNQHVGDFIAQCDNKEGI
jgi:pimeloyl-ACP methyl ester carboxylesterase